MFGRNVRLRGLHWSLTTSLVLSALVISAIFTDIVLGNMECRPPCIPGRDYIPDFQGRAEGQDDSEGITIIPQEEIEQWKSMMRPPTSNKWTSASSSPTAGSQWPSISGSSPGFRWQQQSSLLKYLQPPINRPNCNYLYGKIFCSPVWWLEQERARFPHYKPVSSMNEAEPNFDPADASTEEAEPADSEPSSPSIATYKKSSPPSPSNAAKPKPSSGSSSGSVRQPFKRPGKGAGTANSFLRLFGGRYGWDDESSGYDIPPPQPTLLMYYRPPPPPSMMDYVKLPPPPTSLLTYNRPPPPKTQRPPRPMSLGPYGTLLQPYERPGGGDSNGIMNKFVSSLLRGR